MHAVDSSNQIPVLRFLYGQRCGKHQDSLPAGTIDFDGRLYGRFHPDNRDRISLSQIGNRHACSRVACNNNGFDFFLHDRFHRMMDVRFHVFLGFGAIWHMEGVRIKQKSSCGAPSLPPITRLNRLNLNQKAILMFSPIVVCFLSASLRKCPSTLYSTPTILAGPAV